MSNISPFKGITVSIPYYISDKLGLLHRLNKYNNVEIIHFDIKVEKTVSVYIKILYDINTNIIETLKDLLLDIVTYSENNKKENLKNVLTTKRSIVKYLEKIITLNSVMENDDGRILFKFNISKFGLHCSVKDFINFIISKYIVIELYKESLNACGECSNTYRVMGTLKDIDINVLILDCKKIFNCEF